MKNYRNLTEKEIATLTIHGCTAENWQHVTVAENFAPDFISNVHFSGKVSLGAYDKIFELPGGLRKHAGVNNCVLHNCSVGNDVFIDKVSNYIANYHIGDGAYIEHVNSILVDGVSSFGNGIRVPVLNETGGREIPIFNHLSAPLAYMLALYRHRPRMTQNLLAQIDEYARSQQSDTGTIGKNVRIVNTGSIKNVCIGDHAIIEGASVLENGSVNSNAEAPAYIGFGVKCTDFIFESGVSISDSTLISSCFIGQGSEMGKHYSAVDSIFFSNCLGMHGESTAVFAGPYTVSHHKSTLLIAGMFSFMNAGSGSNQSNHMYKLGPIHQGIVERGSKTTSDSYVLWPARIGAFTLVMGRHTKHPDTSDLPFSYLIEDKGDSFVVPAINLRTVGTIRDAQKWPKRDRRKDSRKIDPINNNLLSPYTIQKMIKGVEVLQNIQRNSDTATEVYPYKNSKIKKTSLQRGVDLYQIGIVKFLGNTLVSRLEKTPFESIEDLRERMKPDTPVGSGDWSDLLGLIAPKSEIERIISLIEAGKISLDEIQQEFETMHRNYYSFEWTWGKGKLEEYWGKTIDEVTVDDIIALVELWKKSVVKLDELIYEDTKKEFTIEVKIGFGADGDENQKEADFDLVRGRFDQNPFVQEILNHIKVKTELGDRFIERLKNIKKN
ncbi:MAG: DUF4954 family protein [Prevotellaceae bacterium]|jgi:hypothetical protein|nr:DUF4954 family protein [Prevotellaceae bacterium]